MFDAVFNQAVKRLVAQDTEFKAFIIGGVPRPRTRLLSPANVPCPCPCPCVRVMAAVPGCTELALQQIETQTPLVLSRQIGTPNIASKGVPRTREVLLPTAARPPPPPLIEELPGGGASSAQTPTDDDDRARPRLPTPAWTCTRTDVDGVRRRRITVQVPKLVRVSSFSLALADRAYRTRSLTGRCTRQTRALVTGATLDIEARRMMLRVPSLCALELDVGALGDDGGAAGTDELDVDGARAEWRVREGVIVVYA